MNSLHVVLYVLTLIGGATSSLLDWGDSRWPATMAHIHDGSHRRISQIQQFAAPPNHHERKTNRLQDGYDNTQLTVSCGRKGRRRRSSRNDETDTFQAESSAGRSIQNQQHLPPITPPGNSTFLSRRAASAVGDNVQVIEGTNNNRVKMWPPWPLNLLSRAQMEEGGSNSNNIESSGGSSTTSSPYSSAGALFWAYSRGRAKIWVRQVQEVGSQLWFHLPPAAPPLLLLASIPRTVVVENKEAGVSLSQRVVPLFSNPFARNLALSGLGLAVMSWAHMEVNRKQKLTPILSALPTRSVSRVFLPPYLPEEVPEPEIEALQSAEAESVQESILHEKEMTPRNSEEESDVISRVSPRLRKHLYQIYEKAPSPRTLQTTLREWGRMKQARAREAAKIRRLSIFDELVALQALKRKSAARRKQQSTSSSSPTIKSDTAGDTPGYALVTGASQGLGRAIAVELARWEIPLILVARDMDRLISLAYDLEACYGVKCCVLQADLSEAQAAEKVYRTTSNAGLTVEILVNNAGVASDGLTVDTDVEDVERMIMLNAMTYAKLSRLYGKDMKDRKRGRILMVSSMAGLASASPNTAIYGATKSFAKSLSLSMAKELEPYGVGVTCLMPGPVVDTKFRTRSGTARALCWYLPYYARPAQSVAHQGVMSLLDGDTQVIPGVLNRVFAKLCRPILPQRVEVMGVHFAWTPFVFTVPKVLGRKIGNNNDDDDGAVEHKSSAKHGEGGTMPPLHKPIARFQPRYTSQPPPRMLQLPQPERPKMEEPEQSAPMTEDVVTVDDDGSTEKGTEGLSDNEGPSASSNDVSDKNESEDRVMDGDSGKKQESVPLDDEGEDSNDQQQGDDEIDDKQENVIKADNRGLDGLVIISPSELDNWPRTFG